MQTINKIKENVVIVGGGNAAHAFVAHCGHLGIDCDWLAPFTGEARRLKVAIGNDGGITAINALTGQKWFGRPERISDDPAEILPGATLIIITMPVFAQEPTLKIIAPFIEEGACLGAIPGGAAFDALIYETIGMSKAKQCDIFGTRTLPWACRITEYGKTVSILGTKENDQIVLNSSNPRFIINQIQRIAGNDLKYVPADNFLFLSFTMPWHPCFMYGMFSDWDGKTPFKEQPAFYTSVSQATAKLISDASDEIIQLRNEIVKLFPDINLSEVTHAKDWMKSAYAASIEGADLDDLHSMIINNPAYRDLLFPMDAVQGGYVPDYSSRYLTEDIPCVFLVYKGLAEMIGFQLPIIEMIIEWAQRVMGKEYIVNRRLLGRDIKESRAPQRFGYDNFAAFARTMGYI